MPESVNRRGSSGPTMGATVRRSSAGLGSVAMTQRVRQGSRYRRGVRRLLVAISLCVLAVPAAAAEASWRDGVLACGPATPPVAAGPIALVPPEPRRVRPARCVSGALPVAVARDGAAVMPAAFAPDGTADGCGVRTLGL